MAGSTARSRTIDTRDYGSIPPRAQTPLVLPSVESERGKVRLLVLDSLLFDVSVALGQSLGDKDIGPWLSVIFIVNQIYGPGLLAIPIVLQQVSGQ